MRRSGIPALARIDIALRQLDAQGVYPRHKPAEAEFTRFLGGGLRRLRAVLRDEREHRAAQAVLRIAHQAVIVLVQPDAAARAALRIQAEAHALHARAAQQRKRAGIDTAVALAVHGQRAGRQRTGEHIAVGRAHTDHVGAGAHRFKGIRAVGPGLRRGQDVAAAAVHQRHLDARKHRLAVIHRTVRVAVHPDRAGQRGQAHHARAGRGHGAAAGHADRAGRGHVAVALLHAAADHRALRRREAAALLRGKAHRIAAGRKALEGICAAVVRRLRVQHLAARAEQLHQRSAHGSFALVVHRVGVVVIVDLAGDGAREHRADVQLRVLFAHRQRERLAAPCGQRALRHAADRVARRLRVDLFGRAPGVRHLVLEHVLARADAVKDGQSVPARHAGHALRVLAALDADERDAHTPEHLLIDTLLAVKLGIPEHADGQLRGDRHACVHPLERKARGEREALRAAAGRRCAIDERILAVARERPVALQLEEHAVVAGGQHVKAVRALRVGLRLPDELAVSVADAQQLHRHIRKRLCAFGNRTVAVVIHAHKAGDRRAALEHKHAHIARAALFKRHAADNPSVLRIRAEVALRQGDGKLIVSRQHARQAEAARLVRQHDKGLVLAARAQRAQLHAQTAKALQCAVALALEERAADLRRIDAARVDHIVRVVAVDDQRGALAVARILYSAHYLLGAERAPGEGDGVRRVKTHGIGAGRERVEAVASLRVRAAGLHLVARRRDERHRHAGIASALRRAHQAVGVMIEEHKAGDPAVPARRDRGKASAALRLKGDLRAALARHHLPLSLIRKCIRIAAGERGVRRELDRPFDVRAHVERHAARHEAAARDLLARLRVDIGDAHGTHVVRHIGQAHRCRALEHLRHARVGRLPAAVGQAIFHASHVRCTHAVTDAIDLHAAHVQSGAVRRADAHREARQHERLPHLQRASARADEGQPLLLRSIQLVDDVHLPAFRQARAAHECLRHRAALRQIRLHGDRALRLLTERIARRSLCLAQQIAAHGDGHGVRIRPVAHLEGEHRLPGSGVKQLIGAAGHMRAGHRVELLQHEKAPVAGHRAGDRRLPARDERHLVVGLVECEALRCAQLAQVVRRAVHGGRQAQRGRPAAGDLLGRDVRPDGHLRLLGGVGLHRAVHHRVDAVLARQWDDVGLHAVVEREARLGDAEHRILLQRHAHVGHHAAGNRHGSRLTQRIALRHLRLKQGVLALRQSALIEALLPAGRTHDRAILRDELKAHLRQLLIAQRAADQGDAHATLGTIAGQGNLCALPVRHLKADGIARAARSAHGIHVDLRDVFARFQACGNKAVLPRRQRGGLLPVDSAHQHACAAQRGQRCLSALIELLHAHRNRRRAEALMNNFSVGCFSGLDENRLPDGRVVPLRGRHGAHRRLARLHQRRDRQAVFVRRDVKAVSRRVRHLIDGAARRRAVLIDARQDHPAPDAGKHDALLRIRQRKRFADRLHAQRLRRGLVHAQPVLARQRLHRHMAVLRPDGANRFTRFADQRQRLRRVEQLDDRAPVLADGRARQRKALRLEGEQLRSNLRDLPRRHLHAQRTVLRGILSAGERAQQHVLRRGHRHRIGARRKRCGNRLVRAVQRVGAKDLARRLARQRHGRAQHLPGRLRAEHHAAKRLRCRQLDDRRGAALHDHQALAHRQHRIALEGEAHSVLSLEQRRLRRARLIGDDRHNRVVALDVHAHAGERRFARLAVVADGGELHRQLHGARRRMLERHAGAPRIADLHADAVRRLRHDVRLPARRGADRFIDALRQGVLLDAVHPRRFQNEHRLAACVADRRLRLPVLGDDGEGHALERLAERILCGEQKLARHRVAHDDFPIRHRDERPAVVEIALRCALLTQIELRALRQGEPCLSLARADAHRLAGIERIGPGGQLAAAGDDVHTELRARDSLALHGVVALRIERQTRHAKRMGTALGLHRHRRNVDQVADPLFLRVRRSTAQQQRRAQRSDHSLMRHSRISSVKTNRPAPGAVWDQIRRSPSVRAGAEAEGPPCFFCLIGSGD